jgi:nitrate/TMAO reductase-like tetraheme cytochrome c subunit
VHNNQFIINNQSRCSDCHIPEDWEPVGFNHNNSNFTLDGAHAEVACVKCHFIKENEAGLRYKEYKITQYECIDCHL